MSGIVSSLVSAVSPALTRVADLAEAAVGAMPDVLDGLQRAAQKGEDLLTPAFAASLAAWDAAMAGLEDALVEGSTPRPSNNGGWIE